MKLARARRAIGLLAALFALAIAARSSRGQSEAPPPPPPPGGNVFYERIGPGPQAPDAMDFLGFQAGLNGQTVTGAPFTATFTTQNTQVLADGNRIQRTITGTIARDSQGRTRRDMTLPAIGPWTTSNQAAPHVILINDVVAGTQYILDPGRKVAHQVRLFIRGQRFAGGAENGGSSQVEGNLAIENDMPGKPRDVTATPLGMQTINGVQAEGTRYTRTIPAGQIGNEKPIVITTERWYSPDLLMVVMTKRTDPMSGDSVRQLTDIQRGEPDATLFQVPSDYTLQKGGIARVIIGRAPGAALSLPDAPGLPPLPPPPQD